jgi:hypothetical protein
MQKSPKQNRTGLDELRSEELQTIPSDRDCEARTKCKDIVAARENHDGNVNECLEEMKKPKLRNCRRRQCQGDKEEARSNRNPDVCRRRPFRRNVVHSRVKLLRNPSPRRPLSRPQAPYLHRTYGCGRAQATISFDSLSVRFSGANQVSPPLAQPFGLKLAHHLRRLELTITSFKSRTSSRT